MENQKPNYYTNKKRKAVDLFIGFLFGFWEIVFYAGFNLYLIKINNEQGDWTSYDLSEGGRYGEVSIILGYLFWARLLIFGFWLLFVPKRKLIPIGVFLTFLALPLLLFGSCSIASIIPAPNLSTSKNLPVPLLANKKPCVSNSQCVSNNCNNKVCCKHGQCGSVVAGTDFGSCIDNGKNMETIDLNIKTGYFVCRSGNFKTQFGEVGCNIWPCDRGTCNPETKICE